MLSKKLEKKWFKNPKYPYTSDTITNLTDDAGHKIDLAFVFGGRRLGKSFEICAKRCLLDAWESDGNHQFGYVRRYEKEMNTFNVTQYFADKNDFIEDITGGQFDHVEVYRKKLYFAKMKFDEKTGKNIIERSFEIGYCFALSMSVQYKSLQFPKINKLLFEEVFALSYLSDETYLLLNLISTVKRDKKDFIVYLIANTVSYVSPYTDDFCLTNLARQKSGTIDTYKLYNGQIDENGNDDYYLIATEYLDDGTTSTSKKTHNVISTTNNNWDEHYQYVVLKPELIKKYDEIYNAVFQSGSFMYLATIYRVPLNIQQINDNAMLELDEYMNIVYISKKTGSIKPYTRVFTNMPILDVNTTRGFILTNENDKMLKTLIEWGRIAFTDNLTGNSFFECLKKL